MENDYISIAVLCIYLCLCLKQWMNLYFIGYSGVVSAQSEYKLDGVYSVATVARCNQLNDIAVSCNKIKAYSLF